MFSVIILSKDAANLEPCVQAVRRHEPMARVIVLDDGVALTEERDLFDFGDDIQWVLGEPPFIFSRNVNIGIRMAGGNDVVLINDDALLATPGGLSLLARAADEYPDVGIIGATTNVTGWPAQRPRGVGLRVVQQFAFVSVYIPRRTIELVGLLDERYCLDYAVEDSDYCEAVRRAGLKCAVHDGCFVDHGSLRSSYRGDPKAPRDYSKNHELFKQKWGVDIWGQRV